MALSSHKMYHSSLLTFFARSERQVWSIQSTRMLAKSWHHRHLAAGSKAASALSLNRESSYGSPMSHLSSTSFHRRRWYAVTIEGSKTPYTEPMLGVQIHDVKEKDKFSWASYTWGSGAAIESDAHVGSSHLTKGRYGHASRICLLSSRGWWCYFCLEGTVCSIVCPHSSLHVPWDLKVSEQPPPESVSHASKLTSLTILRKEGSRW